MITAADVRCHELLNAIYHERKVGVEIGVFRGDLSWRLLGANSNLFLYMVDPWSDVVATESYGSTDDKIARFTNADHEQAYRMAMEAVKVFVGQHEVLRMTSAEAAKRFDDESIDFVFIDGDHSFKGCSSDISLWYPKLRKGGLLSGHDYRDERNYGVIDAVQDFCEATGHQLRTGANYTWFITK